MEITIHPSAVRGHLRANPSKSYTQRAYAIAALAHSPSVIHYPSRSDDGQAALGVAQNLGARIEEHPRHVRIIPRESMVSNTWEIGESGLSFRMFSAIAALQSAEVILRRRGSLKTRPAGFILDALRTMDIVAREDVNNGDLIIKGPITGGHYTIDGGMSSQLITGLLIALPLAARTSVLEVRNMKSTPYIHMTLDMIRQFGGVVRQLEAPNEFRIPGGQLYSGSEISIEGDWSGIAFILVAGAIAGQVTVAGANPRSLQGDKAILEVLRDAGARLSVEEDSVTVQKHHLHAFDFDATDCPDLFPPLAILATYCRGTSMIHGLHRLKHKESDRFATIRSELGKLGISVHATGDSMHISGGRVSGGDVDAHGDHRVAMAMACAALGASGPVTIHGAECVNKSYQDFYTHLANLQED